MMRTTFVLCCLTLFSSCSRNEAREKHSKTAALAAALADDALKAGVEIKVSGNIDSVLALHPRSREYRATMAAHFGMMKRLHDVATRHYFRYTGYQLQRERTRFCRSSNGLTFVAVIRVRLDMEAVPPNS